MKTELQSSIPKKCSFPFREYFYAFLTLTPIALNDKTSNLGEVAHNRVVDIKVNTTIAVIALLDLLCRQNVQTSNEEIFLSAQVYV